MEPIEGVAVENITHRLVARIVLAIILLLKELVIVFVRVVITGARGRVVLGNFVGTDPDETTEFRDCEGVVTSLEEWMSVECGVVAHRRVCKEGILRGIAALDAVEEREEDGIVWVGKRIQLVHLCKLLSSDRPNGCMRSGTRQENRQRLQKARRVREPMDAGVGSSSRLRGGGRGHARRQGRREARREGGMVNFKLEAARRRDGETARSQLGLFFLRFLMET